MFLSICRTYPTVTATRSGVREGARSLRADSGSSSDLANDTVGRSHTVPVTVSCCQLHHSTLQSNTQVPHGGPDSGLPTARFGALGVDSIPERTRAARVGTAAGGGDARCMHAVCLSARVHVCGRTAEEAPVSGD